MSPAEREALIRAGMQAAQQDLQALDERGRSDLERIYRQAAAELGGAIMRKAGEDGTVALGQLRDLLDQVEQRLSQLARERNALLDDGLHQAADLGALPFPVSATVDVVASMRVPDEAVRFVQRFVAADGLQLSDRLWRIDRGARDTVVNAVERSVVMGHGAAQAAREFLQRGEPPPGAVQAKLGTAGAVGMAKEAESIMTGGASGGGAMAQAMRVFRTEINRAHGVASMRRAEQTPGFVGIRFVLSPAHPKPDICDDIANSDRFGLGKGVFPSTEEFLKVWPAHPNTLSFPVPVWSRPH